MKANQRKSIARALGSHQSDSYGLGISEPIRLTSIEECLVYVRLTAGGDVAGREDVAGEVIYAYVAV